MRPAIKSIPQLAPNGLNQVLKSHVIIPAPLNGDLDAVPKCVSGAVIFSVEDFFGHYRGHLLFGHARTSHARRMTYYQALKSKTAGLGTHLHDPLIEVDASPELLRGVARWCERLQGGRSEYRGRTQAQDAA
jgi:hypothetical protein